MDKTTRFLQKASAILLIFAINSIVLASSEKKVAARSIPKTLIIGVDDADHYPEYSFKGSDTSRARDDHGAAWEILAAFAQDAQIKIEFRALPSHKLDEDLRNGKIDFKFPDHPDTHLDVSTADSRVYSMTVLEAIEGLMVAPENKGKSREQIKTIATPAGTTAWNYLDDVKNGKIEILEFPSVPGAIAAVLSGKAYALYVNIAMGRHHWSQSPAAATSPKLVFDRELPFLRTSYQLSTIKNPDLIKKLDIFLASHASELAKINGKFGLESE